MGLTLLAHITVVVVKGKAMFGVWRALRFDHDLDACVMALALHPVRTFHG